LTGRQGPSGPGGGGMIPSPRAAALTGATLPGLGAGLRPLAARTGGAAGAGRPASSAPVSSQLPAGPGGTGSGSGSGAGGGAGGNTGRALSGGAAALICGLILVLLRLVRRAAVKPVWRSVLPEVPPA
jgi:hypothetical protein